MKSNIINVFLQKIPCAILNVLRNSQVSCTSEIARKIDCTYSHVRKILLFLEKEGFINLERQSRTHKINLTEKGRKIAEHIEKIKKLLI